MGCLLYLAVYLDGFDSGNRIAWHDTDFGSNSDTSCFDLAPDS